MSTRAEKKAALLARIEVLEKDTVRVAAKVADAKARIAEIEAAEAKEAAAATDGA